MNCKRCRGKLSEREVVWRGVGGSILASDPYCPKCSDKMDAQILASHPPVNFDPRKPAQPLGRQDLERLNELICDPASFKPEGKPEGMKVEVLWLDDASPA